MNGIEELLKKYGTSLAETRKLMPELVESIERERVMRPPTLPTAPQFFTVEEVRGMGLVTEAGEPFELDPGWRMKVTPPVDGQEPTISFITPEDWEITQDQMYISPTGERFTREQIEAQLAAPEVPLETEQVFGKVFTEMDVAEVLAYAEAQPEAFFKDILDIGRTPETENLLRAMYAATPEELEEFFAPVTPPSLFRIPGVRTREERIATMRAAGIAEDEIEKLLKQQAFYAMDIPEEGIEFMLTVEEQGVEVRRAATLLPDASVWVAGQNIGRYEPAIEQIVPWSVGDITEAAWQAWGETPWGAGFAPWDEAVDGFPGPIDLLRWIAPTKFGRGLGIVGAYWQKYISRPWETLILETRITCQTFYGLDTESDRWAQARLDEARDKYGWMMYFSPEVSNIYEAYIEQVPTYVEIPLRISEWCNPVYWVPVGKGAGVVARYTSKIPIIGKFTARTAAAVVKAETAIAYPLTKPMEVAYRRTFGAAIRSSLRRWGTSRGVTFPSGTQTRVSNIILNRVPPDKLTGMVIRDLFTKEGTATAAAQAAATYAEKEAVKYFPLLTASSQAVVGATPATTTAIVAVTEKIISANIPTASITAGLISSIIPPELTLEITDSLVAQLGEMGFAKDAIAAMSAEEAWANLFKTAAPEVTIPPPKVPGVDISGMTDGEAAKIIADSDHLLMEIPPQEDIIKAALQSNWGKTLAEEIGKLPPGKELIKLIDPRELISRDAATIEAIVARNAIGFAEVVKMGQNAAAVKMSELQGITLDPVKMFGFNRDAYSGKMVSRLLPDYKGTAEAGTLEHVFTHPEMYSWEGFDKGLKYVTTVHEINTEVFNLLKKEGVAPELSEEAMREWWIHRVVEGRYDADGELIAIRGRPGMKGRLAAKRGYEMHRKAPTMYEGMSWHIKYAENPEVSVRTYIEDAFIKMAQERFYHGTDTALEAIGKAGVKPGDVLRELYPDVIGRFELAADELKAAANFHSLINRAIRGERIPGQTLNAIEKRFPELGKRFRAVVKMPSTAEKQLRAILRQNEKLIKSLKAKLEKAKAIDIEAIKAEARADAIARGMPDDQKLIEAFRIMEYEDRLAFRSTMESQIDDIGRMLTEEEAELAGIKEFLRTDPVATYRGHIGKREVSLMAVLKKGQFPESFTVKEATLLMMGRTPKTIIKGRVPREVVVDELAAHFKMEEQQLIDHIEHIAEQKVTAEDLTSLVRFGTERHGAIKRMLELLDRVETQPEFILKTEPAIQAEMAVPEVVELVPAEMVVFKSPSLGTKVKLTPAQAFENLDDLTKAVELTETRISKLEATKKRKPDWKAYDRFAEEEVGIDVRIEEQQAVLDMQREDLGALQKAIEEAGAIRPAPAELVPPKPVVREAMTFEEFEQTLRKVVAETKDEIKATKKWLTEQRLQKQAKVPIDEKLFTEEQARVAALEDRLPTLSEMLTKPRDYFGRLQSDFPNIHELLLDRGRELKIIPTKPPVIPEVGWDAMSVPERVAACEAAGLPGKVGSKSWASLTGPERDALTARLVPKAAPGMPEAGLQKDIFGYETPHFPKGKGEVTQMSMDDYNKLVEYHKQQGLPPPDVGVKPVIEGIKELEEVPAVPEAEPAVPITPGTEAAAFEFARRQYEPYVLRGDTLDSMKKGGLGVAGPEGRMTTGAYFQGKKLKPNQVGIELPDGSTYVFKLEDIIKSIKEAPPVAEARPPVTRAPEAAVPEALEDREPWQLTSKEFNTRFPQIKDLTPAQQKKLYDMLVEANREFVGEDEPVISMANFKKEFADSHWELETGGILSMEHKEFVLDAVKRGLEVPANVKAEYASEVEKVEAARAKAEALRERKRAARAGAPGEFKKVSYDVPAVKAGAERKAALDALRNEVKELTEARKKPYWQARTEKVEKMGLVKQPPIGEGFIMQSHFSGKIYDQEFIDAVNAFFGHDAGWRALKIIADAAGILTTAKASLDISFPAIQGLPAFGLAHAYLVTNPKIGARLMGAWYKAFLYPIRAYLQPEWMHRLLVKDQAEALERVSFGGSSMSIDYFRALWAKGGLGGFAAKIMHSIPFNPYDRAELVFRGAGEILRNEGWKILKADAIKQGAEFNLAQSLDRMTGLISSEKMGVNINVRLFERAFAFFASQYTRASLTFLGNVFRGGYTGAHARKSLGGLIAAGAIYYAAIQYAIATLEGKDHDEAWDTVQKGFGIVEDPITGEATWRPTGRLMTFKIGNYNFGIGGFWYGLVRLAGNINATIDEVGERERIDLVRIFKNGSFNKRDNPFIHWWWTRASMVTHAIHELGTGTDFLGYPIETPWEYSRHVIEMLQPIWMEQGVNWMIPGMARDNEIPEGAARAAVIPGELLGLRTFPESQWVKFYDKASEYIKHIPEDELDEKQLEAWRDGKLEWGHLTDIQQITLLSRYPELNELYTGAQADSAVRSSDKWKDWDGRQDELRGIYYDRGENLIKRVLSGELDTRELREMWSEAGQNYGAHLDEIEEGGNYDEIYDYLEKAQSERGEKYGFVADLALAEYIEIMFAEYVDEKGDIDWDAKDRAIDDYIEKRGQDWYDIVRQMYADKKLLEGLSPVLIRLSDDKDKLGREYWQLPYKPIKEMDEDDELEGNVPAEYFALWKQYQALETDAQRDAFIEANPLLAKDWRAEYRLKNPEDDARLALWGYGGKLQSMEAYNLVTKWAQELGIPLEQMGLGLPPRSLIDQYFEHAEIVKETSGSSVEARLYKLEHPGWLDWGVENWGWDDLSDDNINALRLRVEHKDLFAQYEGFGDRHSELYIEDDKAREKARDKLLEENPVFRDDRRRVEAYQLDFPDEQIESYVEYSNLPAKGFEQERYLLEHPEFYQSMIDLKDLVPFDPGYKVPDAKYDEIYHQWEDLFEQYEAVTGTKSQRAAAREKILTANPEFAFDRRRREAYGNFIPEHLVDTYAEWFTTKPQKSDDPWFEEHPTQTYYGDDWWLMERMEFYNTMVAMGLWEERDFSKVPTKEVFALYKTYVGIPQGAPQLNYRARFPELDAWGVLKFGWTPIGQRGKKEEPKTPWEEAEEAKRFKELF